MITPHIVRLPDLQDSDLESLSILGSGISPKYVGKPLQLGADQTASPKSANTPALPLTSPSSNSQPGSAAASTPDAPPVPRLSFVRLSSSTTESAVGSRVTVTAAIENAQQVSGFSFGLSFDPKILKLVGVLEGGFVSQGGKPLIQAPKIDNDAGTAVITFSSPSSGVSGSGTLFNVMFDTVGSGTSQVVLTQAALSDDRQAPLPTSSSGTQVTVK